MIVHVPNRRLLNLALIGFLSVLALCPTRPVKASSDDPPAPFGSVPSRQQLAWQKKEMVAFTHFNMNTFTDREWGIGHEDPANFNPAALDCSQWIRVLKAAGFKEVILTAKHHDGFCLWPSAYTDHSVKSSPWKGGKGDVVKEFSDACAAQGVSCGLYLSPWDRTSALYGDSPKYNAYYVNQLTELLTHYGDISEVWFDGANGEGPNGKKQVYDWDRFFATVDKYAPNAVVFGGSPTSGTGIRWSGNEAGYGTRTDWNHDGNNPNAAGWFPEECDTSIRPGWYYHPDQDTQIKSVNKLLDIYYGSVGRGGVLLLNVPPDRRGLISDGDVARLSEFHAALQSIFSTNLAAGKSVTATNVRGKSADFAAANLTSSDYDHYWATDDVAHAASFTVDLKQPTAFNNIVLQEYIPLGQRVAEFTVDALVDGQWQQVGEGTTIGYKRILWIPRVTASKVRVNITKSLACPVITKFALYNGPRDASVEPVSLIAFKPATASNVHGNQTEFGADKAVDDDLETRWATDDGTSDCWLQVDAKEPSTMGKLKLSEWAPRIQQFQLEYKLQESDPWSVAMVGTSVGDSYSRNFPPVKARFVRLHILKASDAPTLWEFGVYAPDASQLTAEHSLLEAKVATASNVHSNDPNFGADKAVDGDVTSRWATDDGTSECWLQVDVGSPARIGRVGIMEFDPRIQKFQIEYKVAQADQWQIAYSGNSAGTNFSADFPTVTARFVRLHVLSTSAAPTIYEFQAFAPK